MQDLIMVNAYAIPGMNTNKKKRSIDLDRFLKRSSEYFDIPIDLLTSDNRKRRLVEARMIIMYYLREELKYPLQKVSYLFNRDYTTCIYAIKQMNNFFEFNNYMKQDYYSFKKAME